MRVVVRDRYPYHVLAIDFKLNETADGQPVTIFNVAYTYTRESLGKNVTEWITTAGPIVVLNQIRKHCGTP